MKTNKIRYDLMLMISPVVIAAGLALIWFYNTALNYSFTAFCLPLVILLLVAILPRWGKQRLVVDKAETPRHSFAGMWLRIAALQLTLLAIFLGISHLTNQLLPIATTVHPAAFSKTLYIMLVHYGLFPWSLVGLLAIGFGYYSYRLNEDAFMSTQLFHVFKSHTQQIMALIINTTTKRATNIALASTLAFMILLFAAVFVHGRIPLAVGFKPVTAILVTLLLIFVYTKSFKRTMSRITKNALPLFITLPLLCLILAAIIVAYSIFMVKFTQEPAKLNTLFSALYHKDWHNFWIIFSMMWWLAWAPLCAIHIARYGRGQSVRTILVATLLLPVILAVVFYSNHLWHIINLDTHTILATTLATVGFIGLLMMVTHRYSLPMMILSYLPKRDAYKNRDKHFYFRRIFRLSIVVLYVFMPAGIYLAAIFLFLMVVPSAIFNLISNIFLIKRLNSN